MSRIVAVDWSGRAKRAAEHIWVAEVVDGELVELANGREPHTVTAHLTELGDSEARLVVGLDFAFSAPAWWLEDSGFRTVADLWRAAPTLLASQLNEPAPPFWGHLQTKRQLDPARCLRTTEQVLAKEGHRPKSVFQLGGAGAVGTGSLRGMPHLLELREAGFSIWPFDPPRSACVVEIYPRLLTGRRVYKGRFASRHRAIHSRFPDQDPLLLERAAGSEDAFDAAFSALVMAEHADELAHLKRRAEYPWRVEGEIWRPLLTRA